MYKYFANLTPEEAKRHYRELCKQHHPDLGGDTATMQEINNEYARYQSEGAKTNAQERQRTAHAEGKKSAADFHDLDAVAEELRVKIEMALNLNLEVELCGLWVWVSGNTKAVKEELKAAKFRWSPQKEAWYFAGVPSTNRGTWNMDKIREYHGSQKFQKEAQQERRMESLHA